MLRNARVGNTLDFPDDIQMQKLHFKYNFNYYLCHNLAQSTEAQVMLKNIMLNLKKKNKHLADMGNA